MKATKAIFTFCILGVIYAAIYSNSINAQSVKTKKAPFTINLIPGDLFADHDLHGGGGCVYTESETDYDSGRYILTTQMNDSVREALACVNKVGQVLKFDSVKANMHYEMDRTTHILDTTSGLDTTIETYSNKQYTLIIVTYMKFENGELAGDVTGVMTIKNKSGKYVSKKIYEGNCGEL